MQRNLIVADLGLYDVLFISFQLCRSAIWHIIKAGSEISAKREELNLL